MMRTKAQMIHVKCRLGQSQEQGKKKKLQEAFNGLANEFIWANPACKEEPKSNKVFEGIGANKKVQKSINVILSNV